MLKKLKKFVKIIRIVNEILFKIWDKLKKNKFLEVCDSWNETCWKLETNYQRLINDKIRNFKI